MVLKFMTANRNFQEPRVYTTRKVRFHSVYLSVNHVNPLVLESLILVYCSSNIDHYISTWSEELDSYRD